MHYQCPACGEEVEADPTPLGELECPACGYWHDPEGDALEDLLDIGLVGGYLDDLFGLGG